MPFEAYSAKVRTERSEEAVNEWLESMKTQTRWRILSTEEIAAVAEDSIRQAEQPKEQTKDQSDPTNPPEQATAASEPSPEPASSETPYEQPTTTEPVAEDPVPEPTEDPAPEEQTEPETEALPEETPAAAEHTWFTDRAEFERALGTEVLDRAFQTTRKAKVSAAIVGKNLSPGLLVRLKGTGNHHKKHPAILIPSICKCLETEHMPVFKRKGKLFTGPARPQALAADAVLAPRPAEMVKWIRENTPAKLEGLWKSVLPEGSTAPPAEYAADLFWLLQQGHILLYTDDTLSVQEVPKPQEPKKPKQPKKKAAKAPSDKPKEAPETDSETTVETAEPAAAAAAVAAATQAIPEPETQPKEDSPETPEPTEKPEDTSPEPESVIPSVIADLVPENTVEVIKEAFDEIVDTVTEAATKLAETPNDSPDKPTKDSSTDH